MTNEEKIKEIVGDAILKLKLREENPDGFGEQSYFKNRLIEYGNYIRQQTLEGVVEREKTKLLELRKKTCSCSDYKDSCDECISWVEVHRKKFYNEAKSDTINHLESIINKLN